MILFVGRIQPLKGIDNLIRAMAVVLKRHPEFKDSICLNIIGGDRRPDSESDRVELERLLRLKEELSVGDLVTFLGSKAQNNLAHCYSAAQMVVMPSHYESFGMVAIEAMVCGTPVIASDVGGLTYTIKDGFNGYLVPRNDHNALADKIGFS
jgi:D-inositol-3-phosphate glycosyltransferase